MDFNRYALESARTLRRVGFAYVTAVAGVVLTFDAVMWLGGRLLFGSSPALPWILLIGSLVAGGSMVVGTVINRHRLAGVSSEIAARLGAQPVDEAAASLTLLEQRALNLVEETALAAHQPIPRLHVLEHESSINALALGQIREDGALILTRGAIERLNREELQGVIAHQVAHLATGGTVMDAQLAAMSFGLEMVANAGRRALEFASVAGGESPMSLRAGLNRLMAIPGVLLLAAGWPGHLATRLLMGPAQHTRRYQADALAVRLTRHPTGLGNALRKVSWMSIHDASSARLDRRAFPVGMLHALFHSERPGLRWSVRTPASHPPLSARIERLLGKAAKPMVAERGQDDEESLSLDQARVAASLTLTALPPLVHQAEGDPSLEPAGPDAALARLAARLRTDDLVALVAAAHDRYSAAALATLLVVGGAVDAEVWPVRWHAAHAHQGDLVVRLRRLGAETLEGLRWPLLELCANAIRPMVKTGEEDLLQMLRGQIEVDQRVTLAEWIYYMLLRARLLAADHESWRGDEAEVNPAEAVRWMMSLLARCVGDPDLRAQRVSNGIIQDLGLSRMGQSHPPLDVGGLQAAVSSLRHLPVDQRRLLLARFVKFLPLEAPIETYDFLRVLALIIDCPMPEFEPVVLASPDAQSLLVEAAAA